MASRKLFKVAKEFNLGKDTLLAFLEKCIEDGQIDIPLKGINTKIDDQVYELIAEKFEREREQAEKIHKRIGTAEEVENETEDAETPSEETVTEEPEPEAEPAPEPEPEPEPEPVVEKAPELDPQVAAVIEAAKEAESEAPAAKPVKKAPAKTETKEATAKTTAKPAVKSTEAGTKPASGDAAATQKPATKEDPKLAKKRKNLEKLKRQGTKALDLDKQIRTEDGSGYRKKKKRAKQQVDKAAVQATVKKTMSGDSSKKKRKKIKKKREDGTEVEVNVIKINEFISTQDLANLMEVPVNDLIKKCLLDLKLMVSINQRLDLDTIRLLAEEYNYEIEEEEEFGSEILEDLTEEEADVKRDSRPPVVTVMGHVDHGKTSLLDYIRRENVVAGESGGITQHIGAYEVTLDSGAQITFLDTPGHEAFTAMRARGAQATDIVILIVAADDGLMPQTREAIDHAKAAGVKMVVAISKVDKPGANVDRVMQQLSEYDVLVEDWGGEYQCAQISSKTGQGIDDLLEKILLESEVLELTAADTIRGRGVVVETQMEKGKGTVATLLVQDGTIRVGDPFIAGPYFGRVKAMFDERGRNREEAGPSVPVQVLGLEGIPQAGDRFIVMESFAKAKDVSQKRQQLKREHDFRSVRKVTLEDISHDISVGGVQDLNLIVKGDVDGSIEALSDEFIKLSHDEIRVNVIRKAVGAITESDVILASASGAIIIGFHVRAVPSAKVLAEKENVEIRNYKIVYDAINEIRDALEGMLRPEIKEQELGEAEIQQVFKISKVGNIAGCMVRRGTIKRDAKLRVIREGIELHDGKLSSLKRFKDDVKEVREGFDCGLQIDNFNDIQPGDTLEFYEEVEVARKLEKKPTNG